MSSSERNYDLSNLLLVVGGGLMFFFNLSAILWLVQPRIWGLPDVNDGLLMMGAFESMGGLVIIISASIWNEDHSNQFTLIAYVLAVVNTAFGVLFGISTYNGMAFGILIISSGLLVFLGATVKSLRLEKEMDLENNMSISGEQGLSEGTQAQSETRETEEKSGKVLQEGDIRRCASCEACLPPDAAFCIECGLSQETDWELYYIRYGRGLS